MNEVGALCFGLVVGWVTYRTIRRTPTSGISDIAAVVGAVGGASITALFPAEEAVFGAYGIGLAIGFGLYLVTALWVASWTPETGGAVNEWLGSAPEVRGSTNGAGRIADPLPQDPRRSAEAEEIPEFRR
jgi:hypothetical protein